MRYILILLTSFLFASSYGQSTVSKQNTKKQTEYLNVIYKECPNPDIIEAETSGDGYYEVEYLCDGQRYEAGTRNNELLYIEYPVSSDQVPLDKIYRKLEKKYAGWIMDEVSQVRTSDTSFLKVEIIKEGIEQNVYFANDGKWYKMKPLNIVSSFDMKTIVQNNTYKMAKYAFHKPDSSYEMPDLLREISGITIGPDNTIYCVQDELGSAFEYDIKKQEITSLHRFTDIGDFEDITIVKNALYILRSDGKLFVYDLKNKTKIQELMLPVKSLNIEGICNHKGYMYIACKDAQLNQDITRRTIYRSKISNPDLIEPYLEINTSMMTQFIKTNYPESGITEVIFNPSAIAFHPITNQLYILSATERFIAIYDQQKLVNIIPLPAQDFYKPEGISFYTNGDMLISSEGDKNGFIKGTIQGIRAQ